MKNYFTNWHIFPETALYIYSEVRYPTMSIIKTLRALGMIAVAVIVLISFVNAQLYIKEIGGYVEVSAQGLAYVPSDAAFVKYNGAIRKVVAIEDVLLADEEECLCPNCCDGFCYVIILTDPEGAADGRGPKSAGAEPSEIRFLWMPC